MRILLLAIVVLLLFGCLAQQQADKDKITVSVPKASNISRTIENKTQNQPPQPLNETPANQSEGKEENKSNETISPPDKIPPAVSGIQPIDGTEFFINDSIELSVYATDNQKVNRTVARIYYPGGSFNDFELAYAGEGRYALDFKIPELNGSYWATINAIDDYGNVGSVSTYFTAKQKAASFVCNQPSTSSWPYPPQAPVTGTRKVLAILWDPHRSDNPAPDAGAVRNILFGSGTSVRNYYLENSKGKFTMENAGVLGWYDADKPAEHYWAPDDTNDVDGDGWIHGHTEKWTEAIRKADNDFNFSTYDSNHDGSLSPDELGILIVIPQNGPFGTNRNAAGREYPAWEPLIVDGVRIDTIAESYIGSPPNLGVNAHELAHLLLGMPDMYFNFFFPYAAGAYSLMDEGYNAGQLDPYDKLRLGWVSPKVITQDGCYKISQVEGSNEVYLLYNASHSTKEYFLIENRQPGTYDGIPDSGLSIWQVIEDPNVYRTLPAPAGVDVGQFDYWIGPDDWGRRIVRHIKPIYGPPFDDSRALWDGSDSSLPNRVDLKWVDGTYSGFSIRNISASGKEMNFYVDAYN